MPPLEPVAVVELFPEVRQHLLTLLAGLSDAQWRTPTVCAGWSVKDVALHLLGGDIANLSRRRDGMADAFNTFVPSNADLSDGATLVAAINRWNEAWVQAARRISPRLLCELLAMTGRALHVHYQELDLNALGGPVSWAGPERAPVWLDIAREYTEQWTHQAQIRDALREPGLQERRLFAPVLATFMYALPFTFQGVAAPTGTCLRVIITGEAGDEWLARRLADRWVLAREPAQGVDATVTLDQDSAWRLFTKGLTRTAARRAVHTTGDDQLASTVLAMVAIIA